MKNQELVLKLCQDGASLAAIGRAVGTGGRHVRRFLNRFGIKREFPNCSRGQNYLGWKPKERIIDKDGYVCIYSPNHPNRRKHTPYVLELSLIHI